MKRTAALVFIAISALLAQAPPAAPPAGAAGSSGKVVAVVEGRAWTRSELESFVKALPASIQINYATDKRSFLRNFALMVHLANMAEKDGLDKQTPHAQRLYYNRLGYLAPVMLGLQNERIVISSAEIEKYYNEHKSEYASAKIKVIQIAFNDNAPKLPTPGAKHTLTSAEAEARARQVVAEARAGADFSKLAERYSDDTESKAKGGDYRPVKPGDKMLPEPVKAVIFALKAGQVSEPVRQAGGFWIFRMQDYSTPTLAEVKDEVGKYLQDQQLRQWVEKIQKELSVEFKDNAYLDEKTTLQ